MTFWKDTVEKTHGNIRANIALASSYFSVADFENAERYYKDAINIAGERKAPFYTVNTLYQYCFMNLLLERLQESKKIIDVLEKVSPSSYHLRILRGFYSFLNHRYEDALADYHEVMERQKKIKLLDRVTLFTLTGDAYRAMGAIDNATTMYEKALRLNSAFPAALHGLARIQMQKKEFDSASQHLKRALAADPYNFGVLTDLAYLMLIRGENVHKALPFAERAVSLHPPFYKPYLIMGTILTASGKEKEADGYYRKAEELQAPDYLVLFNKAWAYSLNGDRDKQKYYLTELLGRKDVPQYIRDTAHKALSQLTH